MQAPKKTYAELEANVQQLSAALASAQQQLNWFKRQLFGEKSEKRHDIDPAAQAQQPYQGDLLSGQAPAASTNPPSANTPGSARRRGQKQRSADCVTDSGLRFDASVPVREIQLPCPQVENLEAAAYERIGEKVVYKLAQRPASYEVLRYVRGVYKLKADGAIVAAAPAPAVLERSFADVSLLAGLLCDKFQYHLPLYRQHQRMAHAGITLSRYSLTHLGQRAIELLEPIYDAQRQQVLQSRVLAIDETPIKAGREKGRKGKMQQAYFWPMYGEADEVVFPFTRHKNFATLHGLLKGWGSGGTLLTDGAGVYEKYASQLASLTHASCWAHTRREFERALDSNPEEAAEALGLIGVLYEHEQAIRDGGLEHDDRLAYRVEHSLPVVNAFWAWADMQSQRAWTSVDRIGKALNYARTRRASLEVYLADPEVAIDTNHLERSLRVIPMGRRNWLFCSTELGAKHVGIIQSLLVTCRLQGVHPYTYLVDVLQRVDRHPANRVAELTPRLWKQHFADEPLTADLSF